MKAEELLNLLGDVKDEQILDAKRKKKRMRPWVKWSSLAAACLLLVLGVFLLPGRPDTVSPENPAESGGSGHEAGSVFMSYAGPMFPLTTREETTLEAERSITWNFESYQNDDTLSPYSGRRYATVQDSYVLHNPAAEPQTVTAIYPVAASFTTDYLPEITVNGEKTDWELHAGAYSGGFTGVASPGGMERESLNLQELESWEGYAALLTDGSYLMDAFSEVPTFTQPVTVYKLTDLTDGGSDADAATLCVQAIYDTEKTTVLTFGMNGYGEDAVTGEKQHSTFIREGVRTPEEETKYLVLLGDDWESYRIQGYENGACERGTELSTVSAHVERYESTLGEALREIAKLHYDLIQDETSVYSHLSTNDAVSFDLYYETFCKFFAIHSSIGTAPKERYESNRLGDLLYETETKDRILYFAFPITIPAGESVTVEVEQQHPASFDYACVGGENQGIDGYDMVTQLGSTFTFTQQTAAIEQYDGIEIVRQNFGFDLEQGITEVTLSPDQPHYFLEVREK